MPYAELEVIVQRLPAGGHALDMRFRAEPGDLDRELAINVPVRLDLERLLGSALDREAYGRELTRSVFEDPRLREAWITARSSAESRDLPLRIRLRLDPGDPALHGVCWEAVFDDQGVAVARSERFLLSRYLDSADMTRFKTPTRDGLLALLVVVSPANLASFGLAPFDAAAEVARVRRALADIPAATFVSGSSGGPVTLPAIVDALRYGYSVLYLVCHGRLSDGVPYLALEDEAGEAEWVPGEDEAARADLQQAIELGSNTSLPYNFVAALALRQGRVAEAQALIAEANERFRAQRSFDNNFYRNLFGQENVFGLSIGALERLTAGQHRDAIASATQALSLDSPLVNDRLRSDMHFVTGFAECRRGEPQAALDAYSQAIAADPGYSLLYLLRAEVRAQLGDVQGAGEDLAAAAASPQGLRLQPALDAALRGELGCGSLLE